MPPHLLRNSLSLIGGVLVGGLVNMAIITISPFLIGPPPGVDVANADSLVQGIHLFGPQHFIMPFLAHAVGTFAGALAAFWMAASQKSTMAYVVGAVFLCAGVAASFMIPAPAWFIALDLLVAYIPMAWLAIQVSKQRAASA